MDAHEAHRSEPVPAQAAQPIGKACNFCRLSHTACGSERPCKRCVKIGKAHLCSDVRMRKRGRPRKTDPRYRPRGSRDDGSCGEGTQPQARGTDSSDPGRGEDSLLPSPHKPITRSNGATVGSKRAHDSDRVRYDALPIYSFSSRQTKREVSEDQDESEEDEDEEGSDYEEDRSEEGDGNEIGRTAPQADLASHVIEMMSVEMKKLRQENDKLRGKIKTLREKHRHTKKRLAEVLDFDQRPTSRMRAEVPEPPQFAPPPIQPPLVSPLGVSPAVREARKYLPFLNQYNISPDRPFVLEDMFSHPVSAIMNTGMGPSNPPVFLYTNDAFAAMLQFSRSELAGSPLPGVWAHNVAIHRRMAPVLIARPPWTASEVYRMSSLMRRRDGTMFRAISHVQFFYDQAGIVKYSIARMLKWKNDGLHDGENFGSWPGLAAALQDCQHYTLPPSAQSPHQPHHPPPPTSHRPTRPIQHNALYSAPSPASYSTTTSTPPTSESLYSFSASSSPVPGPPHASTDAAKPDNGEEMCFLAQLLFDAPPSDGSSYSSYSSDISQPLYASHDETSWPISWEPSSAH